MSACSMFMPPAFTQSCDLSNVLFTFIYCGCFSSHAIMMSFWEKDDLQRTDIGSTLLSAILRKGEKHLNDDRV